MLGFANPNSTGTELLKPCCLVRDDPARHVLGDSPPLAPFRRILFPIEGVPRRRRPII